MNFLVFLFIKFCCCCFAYYMKTLSIAISKAAAASSTVLHYFCIFFSVPINLTSARHLDKNKMVVVFSPYSYS